MVYLNLLTPRKKKYLRRVFAVSVARTLLEGTLLSLTLAGIAIVLARATLESLVGELAAQTTNIRVEYAPVNDEIINFNRMLKAVEEIARDDVRWSKAVRGLSHAYAGLEVRFTHVKFDGAKRTLAMQGVASTRSDLLTLKERIGALPFVSAVEVPITDLLGTQNLRFVARASLDMNYLTLD